MNSGEQNEKHYKEGSNDLTGIRLNSTLAMLQKISRENRYFIEKFILEYFLGNFKYVSVRYKLFFVFR